MNFRNKKTILIFLVLVAGLCSIGLYLHNWSGKLSADKPISVGLYDSCMSYEDTTYKPHTLKDFAEDAYPVEIQSSFDTIVSFSDGNYIMPQISPDGRGLAFAKVVKYLPRKQDSSVIAYPGDSTIPVSQIYHYNISTGVKKILLDSDNTKKYAVYSGIPADIGWINNQNLSVLISDGDVSGTEIKLNISTNKIDSETHRYPGWEGDDKMNEFEEHFHKIFPKIPKDVLLGITHRSGYAVGNRGMILQWSYHGLGNNIYYFDFKKRRSYTLFELSLDTHYNYVINQVMQTLNGYLIAANFGEMKKFFFFDAQKLKLKQIASFKSREFFSYKSLYNKNGDFLFLQTSASSSNLRENHLFLFRKNHLFQVLTRHNIMDVNIKGEILAINYFDGDKGIIELCRLNSKQFDNWK